MSGILLRFHSGFDGDFDRFGCGGRSGRKTLGEALQHELQQQADEEDADGRRRGSANPAAAGGSAARCADQMAQISAAPSTAPRLLPLPPTMSMTQTRKVVSSGCVASGPMNLR